MARPSISADQTEENRQISERMGSSEPGQLLSEGNDWDVS